MNWVNELVDLYNINNDKIGIIESRGKKSYVLLPLFHTTVNAQITVTIDKNGEFMHADLVHKDDMLTIIPVTEESGSRTSGKAPHPLCDNLRYLAGDLVEYYKDDDGTRHKLYMSQLKEWGDSEYSHEKVKAIYSYLEKNSLISDLITQKLITLDEGKIDNNEKIQGRDPIKATVRFIIRSTNKDAYIDNVDECWKDKTLQECYIEYLRAQNKEKELCYLTGNMEPSTYLHSKKIRNEKDGTKLISANDDKNYTYRGRFTGKEEAFVVGNETSQKIHNALKWIIRKQGAFFDSLVIVTWESNRLSMPMWNVDTEKIISDYYDEWDDNESDECLASDGNPLAAEKFYRALNGYGEKVYNTSNMILLGLDAATAGRLAIIEEQTLSSTKYLENIRYWHESCNWIHKKCKENKRIEFSGMVGVKDVADILFGIEKEDTLTINGARGKTKRNLSPIEKKYTLTILGDRGKKMYAEVAKRLLPCIWSRQSIPRDYVNRAVTKASNPLAYKEWTNWERVLTLACSFVKKFEKESKGEEWNMALDKNQRDRNYLYGRLLSVADRIEYSTYGKDDRGRVTNAKRYMSAFSQRPYATWKMIEENIQPYLNKIDIVRKSYYENLLNEITNKFTVESFSDNSNLDGLYLLGFHSQAYDMKEDDLKKKKEEN